MIMLFIIIWNMIYVYYVRSDALPSVMCGYSGKNVFPNIQKTKFNVADVPERCDIVIYGEHYFNAPPDDADATVIKDLSSAGKTVYMIYECPDNDDISKVINESRLDTYITPMLTYLNENDIKGVILGYLGILNGEPDYETKINGLITKVKQSIPSIKIGLYLSGKDSHNLGDKNIFDFNVIDAKVDFYQIDLWFTGSTCKANSVATGGRFPKTSTDKTIVTLEEVCKHTSNSHLEKSKLVISVLDIVTVLEESGTTNVKTYSEFCKGGNHGNDIWCADTTKLLYDEVTYLKDYFKGLMINYIDFDDNDNTCGCGKCPVANIFIDAWKGIPMKNCAKIC